MYPEVTMPTHSSAAVGTEEELADLDKLAVELRARGLRADLRTPDGKLPYLDVTNSAVSVLTERVYAQADAYWYGWADKIADCADVAKAADSLARVLGADSTGDTPSE
jgi:hypothetical protein